MRPILVALALLCSVPDSARGQRWQPELRLDAVGPSPYVPHIGIGVNNAAGYYVRWTAVVGWGWGARRANSSRAAGGEWRGDLLARVTLDPFRQQRWALSVGGGLSVRRHAYLAAIADLEGPELKGWMPALQLGASGGFRAGLLIRKAVPGRR
ncbi:MAG: hypothetical protein WD801_06960 [Gemmatimonadaceae bacterium]